MPVDDLLGVEGTRKVGRVNVEVVLPLPELVLVFSSSTSTDILF